MEVILRYLQQILSTPAIFVRLIAMLGLILKKADSQSIIKGLIMLHSCWVIFYFRLASSREIKAKIFYSR